MPCWLFGMIDELLPFYFQKILSFHRSLMVIFSKIYAIQKNSSYFYEEFVFAKFNKLHIFECSNQPTVKLTFLYLKLSQRS